MRSTETIELPKDRPLHLVVVADTHSLPHRKSAPHILAERPDYILHAGDIGDLSVLDDLEALAPTIAVRGNIDSKTKQIPDEVLIEVKQGPQLKLRILLMHIAVRGPKLRADARRRAFATGAHLVVCGHSHVPLIAQEGRLGIFNPGSIGPRRFSLPITFGMVKIDNRSVDLRHINCETGARWLPGPAVAAAPDHMRP